MREREREIVRERERAVGGMVDMRFIYCHVNVLLVPTLFNCGQDDLHEGELQQQDCALQVRPRVGPQHPGGRQGLSIHQVGWKMSIEVRKPRRRRGTMLCM